MKWAEPVWLWGVLGAAGVGTLLRFAQLRALRMSRRIDPRFRGRGPMRVCVLPAASLALVFAALARPRGRTETAFATFAAVFAAALLFEAGLYASNGSDRFQERYLMVLPPLVLRPPLR